MEQKKRKKHWLDRHDGYYLKDIDSFHKYFAHLNPHRTDCEVCMLSSLDVTKALEYLNEKNKSSEVKITFFHLMLTAMAKMVYNREKMNRFVAGRRFYQRKKVILSFVAKKKFTDTAEEAMMMLNPKQGDSLESIAKKVSGEVKQARSDSAEEYGADAALNFLAKLPKFLMVIVMAVLKLMDRHGWMPESLTSVDPNYSTILLSNLGSIKCDAVYHHLSDFGTNSILLTIGTLHKEKRLNADGKEEIRDVVNFGITIDERIADGFYFAKCMKLVQKILDEPELLDDDVTTTVDYQ